MSIDTQSVARSDARIVGHDYIRNNFLGSAMAQWKIA